MLLRMMSFIKKIYRLPVFYVWLYALVVLKMGIDQGSWIRSTAYSLPFGFLLFLYCWFLIRPALDDIWLIQGVHKTLNLRDQSYPSIPLHIGIALLIPSAALFFSLKISLIPLGFVMNQINNWWPISVHIQITGTETETPWTKVQKGIKPLPIQLNSIIKLRLSHRPQRENWTFSLTFQENSTASQRLSEKVMERSVRGVLSEIGHHQNLYELTFNQSIRLDIFREGHLVQQIPLDFQLPPQPFVELVPHPQQNRIGYSIRFRLQIKSEIPLRQIDTIIKTESGYETIQSFRDLSDRYTYETEDWRVSYEGVPLQKNDQLKIQVIAKTEEDEIQGVSKEWVFQVQDPGSFMQNLIEKLIKTSQHLQSVKPSWDTWHDELQKKFEDVLKWVAQQAEFEKLTHVLEKLYERARSLDPSDDHERLQIKKEIDDLIRFFQSRQEQIDLILFLNQLLNLKNQLQGGSWSEEKFLSKQKVASELKNTHEKIDVVVQNLIERYLKDSDTSIRKIAKSAQKDTTKRHLSDLEKHMKKKLQDESFWSAEKAFESFKTHILPLFQHQENEQKQKQALQEQFMQELMEKLKDLQSAAEAQQKDESLKILNELQSWLQDQDTPQKETLQSTIRNIRRHIEDNQWSQAQKEIEKLMKTQEAQQAYQDQLDEIEQEFNEYYGQFQKKQQQELLHSERLNDLRWRQKLLEDIARQKNRGKAPLSPEIRFLENQLK